MPELPKAYEPKDVEAKWYPIWEKAGVFKASSPAPAGKKTFTIVMPPPNITGSLHMGHALTSTIEDLMTRWHRMKGDNTLWLPGSDHAGIATQMVVERELKKEGTSRHQIGRAKFLERTWQWKEKYGSRIEEQIKVLGSSCDWSRDNFTMSPKLNRAVREVFVRLHEEGLIYRDERLINWCPSCLTALSDLEVEHGEPKKGSLWHLRYPVKGKPGRFLVVATTRPETMLGDTAVAVNSTDPRYKDLHGATIELPFTGREIPVIIDDVLVDPKFGTGAVKVTPAHDFNDFATGKRHKLPMISIFDANAKVKLPGSHFDGLDRFKARKALLQAFEDKGLLEKIEDHTLSIATCDRCETVVEPMLSPQWYVKTKPLAEPAWEAVRSGQTKIIPDFWTKTYEHWMTNIQDWCISRQLWWGHQIPAYYCSKCDPHVKVDGAEVRIATGASPTVAREKPAQCGKCGSAEMVQDPDVLDTWFSSGLWPFSTLGWPDQTDDLKTFYPNSVMETAGDIIFFWVARMMMFGIHFMGKPPFHTIYLHSLVRDEHGQKMSKTKGNVVDPLDVVYGVGKEDLGRVSKAMQKAFPDGVPAFGSDALRFTLTAQSMAGRDIKLSFEQMSGYKAFCNKIWNASRFAFMNLEDYTPGAFGAERALHAEATLADKWIRVRLSRVVARVNMLLEEYNFSEVALAIYHFVWNEFCDWYLELAKAAFREGATPGMKRSAQDTLVYVLDQSLRLLHPIMPFITEEIWQTLPRNKGSEAFLALAAYPEAKEPAAAREEEVVALLIDAITAIRNIRGENQLAPSKSFAAEVHADKAILDVLQAHTAQIDRLANVTVTLKTAGSPKPPQAAVSMVNKIEGVVSLVGLIDWSKERERIGRDITKLEAELDRVTKKLANAAFTDKAPADVVAKEREKADEMAVQLKKLQTALAQIPSA
ncbi:MAG: valine--tRNA ligase [Deltaproteobacteria bacterium]|nr:valine--tRNA ligase [Deltaproteobacteria bacterium]